MPIFEKENVFNYFKDACAFIGRQYGERPQLDDVFSPERVIK